MLKVRPMFVSRVVQSVFNSFEGHAREPLGDVELQESLRYIELLHAVLQAGLLALHQGFGVRGLVLGARRCLSQFHVLFVGK